MATRWRPSLGTVFGVLVVATAALVELQPLKDNSFLTHIATGRIILDTGSVPSVDPYTFTAGGDPWVVQSWLVSVVLATTEALGGIGAVRLLAGAAAGAVAAIGWRLLRPADGLVARLGLGAVFVATGSQLWAERPLMVGLIAFGLTALAAQGGLDPRWLVPLGWVWVNSHGSFPLGLVYLALAAVGSRLDGAEGKLEVRCLRWAVFGTVLGVIGPLGLRALTFPVELLQRQDVLKHVVEWQAPSFTDVSQRAFLLQIVLALVLLVRRPSYRSALITAVFTAAALLGSRNIAVASLALLPGMATALAGVGALASGTRPRMLRPLLAVALAAATFFVALRAQGPAIRLTAYPIDALAYLEVNEVDTQRVRMATPELVGNLLTYVYGPGRRVFYDDRFDMFPEEVAVASLAIGDAAPSAFAGVEDFDISLVTIQRTGPFALALGRDPEWRMLYTDERWVLACRRGVKLSPTLAC